MKTHSAATHFWVTYNLPGCLPEADPIRFASLEKAEAYVAEEEASIAEGLEEGEEDPYVFDIIPCEGDDDEEGV